MKISIQTNFPEVQRALESMRTDVGSKALVSALDKTVAQARTAMSREIRAEFNISASKVAESLRTTRARPSGGRFSFEASLESPNKRGRSLNLINFAARQTAKGVTFKVKKSGGRKLIPGAFIANQGRTVFIRVAGTIMAKRSKYRGTKHAEEIGPLQTIDVAQMFNTKRINAKVLRFIEDKFPAIFANEAKFFTDRFKAGK
jgi:hypothetical protein